MSVIIGCEAQIPGAAAPIVQDVQRFLRAGKPPLHKSTLSAPVEVGVSVVQSSSASPTGAGNMPHLARRSSSSPMPPTQGSERDSSLRASDNSPLPSRRGRLHSPLPSSCGSSQGTMARWKHFSLARQDSGASPGQTTRCPESGAPSTASGSSTPAVPGTPPNPSPSAELGRAYQHFCELSRQHMARHGTPSCEALYSMARCLALGAAPIIVGSGTRPCIESTGLPPWLPHAKPEGLAEARLDLAASTLDAASAAGYLDACSMCRDPDLQLIRERRPALFASALQRAQASAGPARDTGSHNVFGLMPAGPQSQEVARFAFPAAASASRQAPKASHLMFANGTGTGSHVRRTSPSPALMARPQGLTSLPVFAS